MVRIDRCPRTSNSRNLVLVVKRASFGIAHRYAALPKKNCGEKVTPLTSPTPPPQISREAVSYFADNTADTSGARVGSKGLDG